ncbi:12671_t:CDS:2, partial [Funneliformis mosseae]
WSEHSTKRVQIRPQTLLSFLMCGQYNINKKYIPHHTTYIFMDTQKTVLNILSDRWINPKGKLFQKLIREGYKYSDRLSDYLKDIGIMHIGKFKLDPLVDFYHPALIPPLSILASRVDIHKTFLLV